MIFILAALGNVCTDNQVAWDYFHHCKNEESAYATNTQSCDGKKEFDNISVTLAKDLKKYAKVTYCYKRGDK